MTVSKNETIKHFFKSGPLYATASQNPWTIEPSVMPSYSTTIDKLGIPDDWHKSVQICNFFYSREGIVKTVIDKQVEIAINDLQVVPQVDTSQELIDVYNYIKDPITGFLAQAATEWYLSGLVVPEIAWGELSQELTGFERNYEVPIDFWTRDPENLELKRTPLPNHVVVFYRPPADVKHFILNDGEFDDGTSDKETFNALKRDFPEYVRKIKDGEDKIMLSDVFVIRRKPLLKNQYPIPYLLPTLELLTHKRNLRKMDYAIAARVINAILHIKVGNDEFPVTEDHADIIDDLEREFRNRGAVGNKERIVEFFTNHTVSMEWVVPSLDSLLNTDKYIEINQELLYGLGFPKFLLTGEKDKSNTGSTSSALLSPLNSMHALRRDFETFINYLFVEIARRNNLSNPPRVEFSPLRLIDLQDLVKLAQELADREIVSHTSLAKLGGFDFDSEQYLRKHDLDLKLEIFGENYDEKNNNDQPNDKDNTAS